MTCSSLTAGADDAWIWVADTWSVIAVVALDRGPARYSELQERIEGIGKKMLTQRLRKLEVNGLVERRVLRAAPWVLAARPGRSPFSQAATALSSGAGFHPR